MEKIDLYMIYMRTGCTCCRNDNHFYDTIYLDLDKAIDRCQGLYDRKAISSEFAPNGLYDIHVIQGTIENNILTIQYNPSCSIIFKLNDDENIQTYNKYDEEEKYIDIGDEDILNFIGKYSKDEIEFTPSNHTRRRIFK